MPDNQCQFCGGSASTCINTYKHKWISCNNCGNIVRQQKPTYFFEPIPDAFFKMLPKGDFLHRSIKRKKQGADFYDYYLDASQKQQISSKGTKWEGQTEKLALELNNLGIDLKGKNVLDISGGPGLLAMELADICNKVVVTEFSQASVDRMADVLGVEAVKYDFNSDDIGELLADTFDIVLIRYAINFCVDVRKMLSSLKKKLSKDAIVYVSFVPPTLGTCLRWQFDDYTYLTLYNPETLGRLFAEEGFVGFAKYDEGSYHYLHGPSFKALAPFMAPYRLMNSSLPCNRELVQKNLVTVFRKNPEVCW